MAEILGRLKMVLVCVGIMSTIVLLRVAVIPYASSAIASLLSSVPAIIRTWLSPPYIYIILNFIILTIALQNHLPLLRTTSEFQATVTEKDLQQTEEETGVMVEEEQLTAEETGETEEEQPAAEEETGDGRMNVEASMEETWVKIMEAQQRRKLKKSDSWDTQQRGVAEDDPARRELHKSATFKEEKSMGQEELNRRAEAFIKKFKLQRLESHHRVLNKLVNAA